MRWRPRPPGWIRRGRFQASSIPASGRPKRPARRPSDLKGQDNMSFWDFFWLLIWGYILVAYLVLLFRIIADLVRDRDLGGFAKALWAIALIVVPFLSALIYVVARGRGM